MMTEDCKGNQDWNNESSEWEQLMVVGERKKMRDNKWVQRNCVRDLAVKKYNKNGQRKKGRHLRRQQRSQGEKG